MDDDDVPVDSVTVCDDVNVDSAVVDSEDSDTTVDYDLPADHVSARFRTPHGKRRLYRNAHADHESSLQRLVWWFGHMGGLADRNAERRRR